MYYLLLTITYQWQNKKKNIRNRKEQRKHLSKINQQTSIAIDRRKLFETQKTVLFETQKTVWNTKKCVKKLKHNSNKTKYSTSDAELSEQNSLSVRPVATEAFDDSAPKFFCAP